MRAHVCAYVRASRLLGALSIEGQPDGVTDWSQDQQDVALLDSVPYGRRGAWALNIWAKLGDQWGPNLQVSKFELGEWLEGAGYALKPP